MYLSLNLRNRILHFTIIGLIFLSFYTYYYAATNELRQLSIVNTAASSQASSGAIRSILSTKKETQGTQSSLKNSTSEQQQTLNTYSQNFNVGGSSSSSRSSDVVNNNNNNNTSNVAANNLINTSNINLLDNKRKENGLGGSISTSEKDVKNDYESSNFNNDNERAANEKDNAIDGNDERNKEDYANYLNNLDKDKERNNVDDKIGDEDSKRKDFDKQKKDNNNKNAVETVLTSQPLVPPSVEKNVEQPTVVGKEIEDEKKIVSKKKFKPDSAGAFYVPGHSVPVPEKCPNRGADLSLLILVASAPANFEARMAIRQTWGHFDQRKDVSVAFFLGETTEGNKISEALKHEQSMYGDVIRGRFVDSYSNLTLKTISVLEWVSNHCTDVKFVLKSDDDMFINVPRLLSFVRSHSKDKNVIFGRLARRWKPIRSVKSKYYVSPKQFKPPTFPDFTTGPAYLLSGDVAPKLYAKALEQTYLKLEDVFTTGIVAHYLGIKRIQANEFLNKRIAFSPCNVQRSISIHMVKYSEQFDLWKKLLDGKSKCK